MALYEVTITETRQRKFLLHREFDFDAQSEVENAYTSGEETLNEEKYIKKFSITTEEI